MLFPVQVSRIGPVDSALRVESFALDWDVVLKEIPRSHLVEGRNFHRFFEVWRVRKTSSLRGALAPKPKYYTQSQNALRT